MDCSGHCSSETCQFLLLQLHLQLTSGPVQNIVSMFFMSFPFDALSYKHDGPLVFGTNRKVLTQTRQNLGFKHLVACHEQVINMKTNDAVRSASLCIVAGYRILKMINCFRNTYLLSGNAARWLISSGFRRIII